MRAKDLLGSSTSVAFDSLGLSIFSVRGDQNMESDAGGEREDALLLGFQYCIEDVLVDLFATAEAEGDGLLSIAWLRRLLHGFLLCHEEFRALLLERLVADYHDRAVKALDICNAALDGIDRAASAVVGSARDRGGRPQRTPALPPCPTSTAHSTGAEAPVPPLPRHPDHRSQSIQLPLPRLERVALVVRRAAPAGHREQSGGASRPRMRCSSSLCYPWRRRFPARPAASESTSPAVSRTFPWAPAITYLHERIVDESKKRDRKNSAGLLKEILPIERCTQQMAELVQTSNFPMAKAEEEELSERADELAQICDAMKDGLDPLERQVREIFLRIARSRTESVNSPTHTAN